MSVSIKAILALILLGIIDAVIPLPIVGIILIFVVITRPAWFKNVVLKIYNEPGAY